MVEQQEAVNPHRWVILFTVVMMTFMGNVDSSIVNVALPVMAKSLDVSMASISWVVTSYLIFVSSTILIFGRLGDLKGKGRVFLFGIVVFTTGSAICGLANSLPTLVIARVIQAVGAAATMATSLGIITETFPRTERGRALGLSGTFVALGAMTGPPLGGFIVSVVSWKYIFLINIPIGIIAFFLALKILPRPAVNTSAKLDTKGALLMFISIISFFSALNFGQELGFTNPYILFGILLSLVTFVLFIYVEKSTNNPLLELKIFHNPLFSLSIFCGFLSFVAISSTTIIHPFYFQEVLKLSPSTTGLVMVVSPVLLAFIAPLSGHLSDKIGSEFLTVLGLGLLSIGLLSMTLWDQFTSLTVIILCIITMSLGNGLFQSPNNSLVMSSVDKRYLGIAGSINALIRNMGMVIGISTSTTLLYYRMSDQIGYPVMGYVEGRDDVFVYGLKGVFFVMFLLAFTGTALTSFRLYQKHKARKVNPQP